jgi:hypothetical protein
LLLGAGECRYDIERAGGHLLLGTFVQFRSFF